MLVSWSLKRIRGKRCRSGGGALYGIVARRPNSPFGCCTSCRTRPNHGVPDRVHSLTWVAKIFGGIGGRWFSISGLGQLPSYFAALEFETLETTIYRMFRIAVSARDSVRGRNVAPEWVLQNGSCPGMGHHDDGITELPAACGLFSTKNRHFNGSWFL